LKDLAAEIGPPHEAFYRAFVGFGQSEKNSVRVYVFRFALKLGRCSTQPAIRIYADSEQEVTSVTSAAIHRAE
jgi:hypothetical protein